MRDQNKITSFRGPHFFLSNFSPSPRTPPTLEHHYQEKKLLIVGKPELAKLAARASSPGQAKRLGSPFKNSPRWKEISLTVMESLLKEKFSDPTLRRKLLLTGTAELVEGNNWHDHFWGWCMICLEGKNHLGRLLMELRDFLRDMEASKPS